MCFQCLWIRFYTVTLQKNGKDSNFIVVFRQNITYISRRNLQEWKLNKSCPLTLEAERFRIVLFNYQIALIYAMECLLSFCDLDRKNTQVVWSRCFGERSRSRPQSS